MNKKDFDKVVEEAQKKKKKCIVFENFAIACGIPSGIKYFDTMDDAVAYIQDLSRQKGCELGCVNMGGLHSFKFYKYGMMLGYCDCFLTADANFAYGFSI